MEFVPESIVLNIVECFLDIKDVHYYMFAPTGTFQRDGKGDRLLTWIF